MRLHLREYRLDDEEVVEQPLGIGHERLVPRCGLGGGITSPFQNSGVFAESLEQRVRTRLHDNARLLRERPCKAGEVVRSDKFGAKWNVRRERLRFFGQRVEDGRVSFVNVLSLGNAMRANQVPVTKDSVELSELDCRILTH